MTGVYIAGRRDGARPYCPQPSSWQSWEDDVLGWHAGCRVCLGPATAGGTCRRDGMTDSQMRTSPCVEQVPLCFQAKTDGQRRRAFLARK